MKKVILCLSTFGAINPTKAMDNNNNYPPKLAAVSIPYANLRCVPEVNLDDNPHDPNQDSQLLFTEPVTCVGEVTDWYKVETQDQTKVIDNQLVPHVGWIQKKDIRPVQYTYPPEATIVLQKPSTWVYKSKNFKPIAALHAGTKLNIVSSNENNYHFSFINSGKETPVYIAKSDAKTLEALNKLDLQSKRSHIIAAANQYIGTKYYWGGLTLLGIDCSGLTHLCYRMTGIQIPRDSKDQYAAAQKRAPKNLQMADLIFFARATEPNKIRHVALYKGNDRIIDAIGTDRFNTQWEKVRQTTGQEWLGKPFTQIEQEEQVGPYIVYGGTYFK